MGRQMVSTMCNDIVSHVSLHVSVGLVRTRERVLHITRRTAMCVYVPRDSQGNIAKLVWNGLKRPE